MLRVHIHWCVSSNQIKFKATFIRCVPFSNINRSAIGNVAGPPRSEQREREAQRGRRHQPAFAAKAARRAAAASASRGRPRPSMPRLDTSSAQPATLRHWAGRKMSVPGPGGGSGGGDDARQHRPSVISRRMSKVSSHRGHLANINPSL